MGHGRVRLTQRGQVMGNYSEIMCVCAYLETKELANWIGHCCSSQHTSSLEAAAPSSLRCQVPNLMEYAKQLEDETAPDHHQEALCLWGRMGQVLPPPRPLQPPLNSVWGSAVPRRLSKCHRSVLCQNVLS